MFSKWRVIELTALANIHVGPWILLVPMVLAVGILLSIDAISRSGAQSQGAKSESSARRPGLWRLIEPLARGRHAHR
jgi:hypothetical protein